jgi:DNA repair protein RadA/Sms
LDEPAADLAICMALVSSMDETTLSRRTLYLGEVGLNGELRPVNHMQERILEAEKLGFNEIVIPVSAKTFRAQKANIKSYKHIQALV